MRGRERSRRPEEILKEVKRLAADGVVEIMLLGQNVNSYGKNLEEPMTFAQLLREVEKIDGIERIRFMTCLLYTSRAGGKRETFGPWEETYKAEGGRLIW